MKNTLLPLLLFLCSQIIPAQEYLMTFSPSGDSLAIDSVKAINKTKGASIVLPGWEPLILSETAGIQGFAQNQELMVYPNPFTNETTIQVDLNQEQKVRISVRNLLGQAVIKKEFQANPGQASFQLTLTTPGVYFIFCQADGSQRSSKIVCSNSFNQANQINYLGSGIVKSSPGAEKTQPGDNRYILNFHPGDLLHYYAYSGDFATVIADYPEESRNYAFEFYPCTDGRISYPVTRIGDQVWMAKNLAYLIHVRNPSGGLSTGSSTFVYGYYGSNREQAMATNNYQTYGALYNWAAAMESCPVGWHLPSKSEWETLFANLGPSGPFIIRDNLNHQWISDNQLMNDEVAFGVLPGGEVYPYNYRNYTFDHFPGFRKIDTLASYWTRTRRELTYKEGLSPYYLCLHNANSAGYFFSFEHDYYSSHYLVPSNSTATSGYAVRCILGPAPAPPEVELLGISELTATSFIINGKILSDGGIEITEVGCCFSDRPGLSIDDKVYELFPPTDEFSYKIEGLHSNSTYYVNVYAINEEGIAYGDEQLVTTPAGIPTVNTDYIVQITDQTALARGSIQNTGGSAISEAGFCWSKHPKPTLEDSFVMSRLNDSIFITPIEQLSAQSTYYLRAFAINSEGTGYGEDLVLKTAEGSFEYMGDRYGYVTIGDQIWMNQNLRYLPSVNSIDDKSESQERYYVYEYEGSDLEQAKKQETYVKYGTYYNWPAMMQNEPPSQTSPSDVRGICPTGWHVPSKAEYEELLDFAGKDGASYRSNFDWYPYVPNGNNQNGFNAYPGGHIDYKSTGLHNNARISSTSVDINDYPYYFDISYLCSVTLSYAKSAGGLSVRCIKNKGQTAPRALLSAPSISSKGVTIHFDASSSYDPDSPEEELTCRWDWDMDSIWDTDFNNNLQATHVFSEPGIYTITVEVRDQDNVSSQAQATLAIGAGQMVDVRDNNQYVFVKIGDQSWMAQNLRFLPEVFPTRDTSSTEARYHVPGYSDSDAEEARQSPYYQDYGVLYNFSAATSACPEGWHLPSDHEWKIMERSLGMSTSASNRELWRDDESVGYKLKSTFGWENDQNGDNSSLFTGVPTPQISVWDIVSLGYECSFMTSTLNADGDVHQRTIRYNEIGVYRYAYPLSYEAVVRCVKD